MTTKHTDTELQHPFRLPLKPAVLSSLLERLLGLRALERIYASRLPHTDSDAFLQFALARLGVTVHLHNGEALREIPRTGPLLIVANHPLGGLEGIALASILKQVRPDLRVLTNNLLRRIPELAELFIGVDVLSGNAVAENQSGVRKLHRHLSAGGALLIFPAGTVATFDFRRRLIIDKPWSRLVGQLVQRHHCACLPVFVQGRNSSLFYILAMLHPRLRTAMLARQLLNKKGSQLRLNVGEIIPAAELLALANPVAITDYLRISTDALANGNAGNNQSAKNQISVAGNVTSRHLHYAVVAMADCRLIEHPEFDVYCAPYDRLGVLMEQIAVAREVTFRAAGEGTGLEKDSDRFDEHYLHLFLWDKQACRVAGAYRIGLVDQIIAQHGVKGLYTHSLYRYNWRFIQQLGAAIELGRSFIHPDYQRRPLALSLLWRGIGQFLVRNPRYHSLFGSVSISRHYTDLARSLIADAMLSNYSASGFGDMVKPRAAHRIRNRVWTTQTLKALASIKILSKLVGRCDPGRALPVLLRHYLSLNGRLVCFNIHAKFNDALEGLIIVDLRMTDSKTAIRFMGEAGYNHFIAEQLNEAA